MKPVKTIAGGTVDKSGRTFVAVTFTAIARHQQAAQSSGRSASAAGDGN